MTNINITIIIFNMTNPGEVPMPQAVFEVEPTTRREHIETLTGIVPDARRHIPAAELREWIWGARAGDMTAAGRLISARIAAVYNYLHNTDEVAERYDLSLADVMQMGCLAIVEGALTVTDIENPNIGSLHYQESIRHLGKSLTKSRLVPPIDGRGRITHGIGDGSAEHRIADVIGPPKDRHSRPERMAGVTDVEHVVITRDLMRRMLEGVPPRECYVLVSQFGLSDAPGRTLEELSAELGVNKQRVGQIKMSGLKRIRISHAKGRRLADI